MTEQEAKRIFEEILTVPKEMLVKYDNVANTEQKESLKRIYLAEKRAIEALEKQIAKKIQNDGCCSHVCPSCGGAVHKVISTHKYCQYCGQLIDWGEENV